MGVTKKILSEKAIVDIFHILCKRVLGIKSDKGNLPYAKTYAATGANLIISDWGVDSQIGYILANLKEWKGEEARETKAEFKKLAKEVKKRIKNK